MPQDYVIKTQSGKSYRIRVPDGMGQDQALSLAAATNPEFAQEYATSQARSTLADRVKPSYPDQYSDPNWNPEEMANRGTLAARIGLGGMGMRGVPLPKVIGGVTGGAAGAYAGGKAGKYLAGDMGEKVGKIGGGLVGGYYGASGMPIPGTKGTLLERMMSSGGGGTSGASGGAAADAALSERIAAERAGTRLIRTPEEWGASENAGKAAEAVTQVAKPKARLEGMIRSGRGETPQLTNEELDYLRRTGNLPGGQP